ncbi:MAG: hypothetical protein GEV10_17915 [Streptosporangiales bacterium]|nr:hypothetical protein [Streptosporangiales bacterium]
MAPDSCGMPFLRLPARGAKPRSHGLTVVKDRRLATTAAAGLCETAADVVDWIKLTDHVGLIRDLDLGRLTARIALYHETGLPVRPGGIPFQIAVLQRKEEAYLERLAELGFDGVEISEDSIERLSRSRKHELIGRARDHGLAVFTELGEKISSGPMDLDETVERVRADLDSGASSVTLENTDILVWCEDEPSALDRLVDRVGLASLVFEVRPAGWPHLTVDLLGRFGPEVSFENLLPDDALVVESMRVGMTRDVGYWFLNDGAAKAAALEDA